MFEVSVGFQYNYSQVSQFGEDKRSSNRESEEAERHVERGQREGT